MDNEKKIEIANLAESIAESNIAGNKVDLIKIADTQSITIIDGYYEHYFIGQLVFDCGDFFIHLNYDQLSDKDAPRTRFTLAHEFGHYFIKEHFSLLKKGISLHKPTMEGSGISPYEREANFFASNLLMPAKRFVNRSAEFEPGIDSILNLKSIFSSSIESTAIRYTELDITPCFLIKWQEDITHRYIGFSQSFSVLTGIISKPAIKVNTNYVKSIFNLLSTFDIDTDYSVEKTTLSKWLPIIRPNSVKDFRCIEQTFKLGNYGGFTLLLLEA
jgi:hypothetical protein